MARSIGVKVPNSDGTLNRDEAALALGVKPGTLDRYIREVTLERPPERRNGKRFVRYFPQTWIDKARTTLSEDKSESHEINTDRIADMVSA